MTNAIVLIYILLCRTRYVQLNWLIKSKRYIEDFVRIVYTLTVSCGQ